MEEAGWGEGVEEAGGRCLVIYDIGINDYKSFFE